MTFFPSIPPSKIILSKRAKAKLKQSDWSEEDFEISLDKDFDRVTDRDLSPFHNAYRSSLDQ